MNLKKVRPIVQARKKKERRLIMQKRIKDFDRRVHENIEIIKAIVRKLPMIGSIMGALQMDSHTIATAMELSRID